MYFTEDQCFKEGQKKGVADTILDLAQFQGLSIEQACEMCGYNAEQTQQVLDYFTAEAARIAAEKRKQELQKFHNYLIEPISHYGCPEGEYYEPIPTPKQQEVARQDLLTLKNRIVETYEKLEMPSEYSRPHILQEHGHYGYRLLQFVVALRQKDFEWACRVLRSEIVRTYQSTDVRTALAILKVLEAYLAI